MKKKAILWLIGMMLERISAEDIKRFTDFGFDLIENKVKDSPNQYDDMVVLPVIELFRKAFDIPDNDE